MSKTYTMAEAIDRMTFDPQVIHWDHQEPVEAVSWDAETGGPVVRTGPVGADGAPFALLVP